MKKALLLLGLAAVLFRVDGSAVGTCSDHLNCLALSEGSCSSGKRQVCLQQNSAVNSTSCKLNNQSPPTAFTAICSVTSAGSVLASGSTSACAVFDAGTTATFRADGGLDGSSSSSGSLAAFGGSFVAATCSSSTSRSCPGSSHNENIISFTVSSCTCVCQNWGSWSDCAGTNGCQNPMRTRTRTCTAPANSGDVTCDSTQTESCATSSCPACTCSSQWSSWSSCTAQCGGGTRQRRKTCTSNTGASCNDIIQTDSCGTTACPDPNQFSCLCGGWTSWGSCSQTCGSGTRTRSRSCNPLISTGSCPGNIFPTTETEFCKDRDCGTGTVTVSPNTCACGGWVNVGQCSGTCGTGIQSRERICNSFCPSTIPRVDTVTCNTGVACPGVGFCECTPWQSSGCSATCGYGTETRTRTCNQFCPHTTVVSITVPCKVADCGGRIRCGTLRTRAARRRCRRQRRGLFF